MRKNFILDTNVLLHDPRSIYSFKDNNVVIPIYVIEEIDQFKRDLSELGRNARLVARYLDCLPRGGLAQGRACRCPTGACCGCASPTASCPSPWRTAADGQPHPRGGHRHDGARAGAPAVFITKDTNLRIRADALGLLAEDYDAERVEITELYTGFAELPRRRAIWWTRCTSPGAEVEISGAGHALAQPVRAAQGRDQPVAHRHGPLQRAPRASVVPLLRSAARRACGASGRATWSRASRWTCCSTTRSSSSPSSARPAPARRCWRSPRACTR